MPLSEHTSMRKNVSVGTRVRARVRVRIRLFFRIRVIPAERNKKSRFVTKKKQLSCDVCNIGVNDANVF